MQEIAESTGRRSPCPEVVARRDDLEIGLGTLWHVQLVASTPEQELPLGYDIVERELHQAIDLAVKWAQRDYPEWAIAPKAAFAECQVGFQRGGDL